MDSQRILSQFFKRTWIFYMFSIMLHGIANIIHVQFPHVLGKFTDELQLGQLSWDAVYRYGWLLFLIGAGFAVLGGIGQYLVMYTGRLFEYLNRKRLYIHFLELSEKFYSNNGVGKLLSYFMNDITAVRESISMGVNQTANSSMLLISTIVMLLLSDVPFYLVVASITPLLLIPVIVVWVGPIIKKRSLKVQEALSAMTASAEEQFAGIRVTKKFAVESVMNNRFGETVDAIKENQLRLVRVSSLFQAIIPFLGSVSLIVAIVFGGYLTIEGRITLGSFVALTLYVRMLMNPLQQIGNVINTVQRARASLERLNDLLSQKPEIVESSQAIDLPSEKINIYIQDLSFSYEKDWNGEEGRRALSHISFTIPEGTTVGVIGRTGSGKTTLMKLLLRLYDPPADTILYDHHDVRQLTLESLRTSIAYVPQDGFLFSSTIRENIAFFKRDIDEEKVLWAAQEARIYDNVIELPDQFDTKLGERGVTLSGGQRQRTSLARGIIKEAPILILDDSVSAVDAVTESEILNNIKQIRQGKTTIIIANRVSALKQADDIIVLDGGEIVQQGRHEQLLEEEGLYRKLFELQEEGTRA
ncbi:MAG: ABC transporter ATP-binding protein/permease [Candidatus Pristimantibacillus lignocellulolyticus]|uniref:ABC transporter ATP-binding protein/permease n=1 Tax=Candidatus Pristimantibacillus lignocellulolyticus TaxID=2994561 RepID=A0A9J6ZEW3_9BACL|nr:MAG: ABC transporter ATP-binding protein/permease [Candidatus Pristimantibacillus lignocellulolyticus]